MAKPKKMKTLNISAQRPLDGQWMETRMNEYETPHDASRSIPGEYLHDADDPELLYLRKSAELVMMDTLEKVSAQEELTAENLPHWEPPKQAEARPTFWSRLQPKTRTRVMIFGIICAAVIYALFIWHFAVSRFW